MRSRGTRHKAAAPLSLVVRVQPINLIGKQGEDLSVEFPFYHRSYIQLCEGVTLYGESLEVKVPFGGASKYEGRSESEHVVEASLP